MKKVFIKYNPYKLETEITVDGKELAYNSKIAEKISPGSRLQEWVEELPSLLIDEYNDIDFDITFHGTIPDFEDLTEVLNLAYENDKLIATLNRKPAKETADKEKLIDTVFKKIQDGPFNELKSSDIINAFEHVKSSDFEVCVVATMSAGKSTLINALLEKNLMPSKQEACTAIITRIKDSTKEGNSWKAKIYDKTDKEISTDNDLTYDAMNRLNSDEKVSRIEVEGNIPFVSAKDISLILIDTPGPNNSQDASHAEFTYKVIKDQDSKPIVLYVLNGTQLGINDDSHLLSQVAESMKVGGKQSKDRFIFAVNKIDTINSSKESITSILDNVKKYLEKHGIENPNIYPVSAEIARLIRLNKKGYNLDFQEDLMLGYHKLFLQDENLHTLKYTPLGANIKSEMQSKIDSCEDYYEKALYHTGVPYLEASINTYLNKYALASKITEAVNSFISIIEEKQILKEIEENIQKNQESRYSILENINYINDEFEKGDRAKSVKDEIDKLTFNKREVVQPITNKIDEETDKISDIFRNKKIEEYEANIIINKLQEGLKNLEADIKTDLDNAMEKTIKNKAEEYIKQYRKQVEGLINTNSKFESNGLNYLIYSIPDSNKLIDNYKYTVTEEVGEETYKNLDKKWYNPFTWFEPSYLTRKIYEDKTYIDGEALSKEVMNPYLKSLNKNMKMFEKSLDLETKNLKKFFKNEVDKLEEVLQNKVYELEALLKQNDRLEENIESKNKEKEWLVEISSRLESILEI